MIAEHRAVVLARLRPWRVTDDRARVDDASWPAPWVVVDFPPPMRASDRWEGPDQGRVIGWFQTACVGEDVDQAGRLHDAVADLLTDWRPVIGGWSVWPVGMDTTPRVLDGTSLPDRRLVQVVTRWTWTAERTIGG